MDQFIGTVMIWAPNRAPRGWAFCAGQLLAVSANTALFSLVGTTYGGNGQTTFGLPDLRGRVPVGAGQGPGLTNRQLGESGGVESETLLTTQMPMHTHMATFTPSGGGGGGGAAELMASTAGGTQHEPTAGAFLAAGVDGTGIPANIYTTNSTNTVSLGGISGGGGGSGGGTVTVQPAGGSQPFNVMQPYQALNYIIAITGIYPSFD